MRLTVAPAAPMPAIAAGKYVHADGRSDALPVEHVHRDAMAGEHAPDHVACGSAP
jgi:hypothetical protein